MLAVALAACAFADLRCPPQSGHGSLTATSSNSAAQSGQNIMVLQYSHLLSDLCTFTSTHSIKINFWTICSLDKGERRETWRTNESVCLFNAVAPAPPALLPEAGAAELINRVLELRSMINHARRVRSRQR